MKFNGANITLNKQAVIWSAPSITYQSLLWQRNNPRIIQKITINIISNVVIINGLVRFLG